MSSKKQESVKRHGPSGTMGIGAENRKGGSGWNSNNPILSGGYTNKEMPGRQGRGEIRRELIIGEGQSPGSQRNGNRDD